jgi:hypothetical protein
MVISHKHRYLFVELPRTGSTAISNELCTNYDGGKILSKHATYEDWRRIASPNERGYFSFSCIRNPLDDAVSLYFKYKSDHRHRFSQDKLRRGAFRTISMKRYNYVKTTDADFPSYFMRVYRIPYSNWSSLSHKKLDYVIRFEDLQTGFSRVLNLLGLEQIRPLPINNVTQGKKKHFVSYYSPEIIPRAKWVFGPFVREWSYEFPAHWGNEPVPLPSLVLYRVCNVFRSIYWRHLRLRVPPFA